MHVLAMLVTDYLRREIDVLRDDAARLKHESEAMLEHGRLTFTRIAPWRRIRNDMHQAERDIASYRMTIEVLCQLYAPWILERLPADYLRRHKA